LSHVAPIEADPRRRREGADAPPLWLAVIRECIVQVTATASAVAAGSADAEHVHQLRVGLRRTRTALRDIKGGEDPHAMALERALARTFRELGAGRDRFFLEHSLQPRLLAEGGPRVDFGDLGVVVTPAAVVTASDFQNALFDLLAIAHGDGDEERDAKRERRHAARRLARLHRQVCEDAARFDRLDMPSRHRVRKRLKRLRYLAEFCAGLFSAKKVDAFVKRLKPVQEALGAYNDEVVAMEAYSRLAISQPAAWFGAGWLAACLAPHARDCRRELERLSKAKVFWD
jgi:CHAD domain-containing protein